MCVLEPKISQPGYCLYFASNRAGFTIEDYQQMLDRQQGLCASCHKPETAFDKRHQALRRLTVDHCHKTGKIRGLLCTRCNRALGFLEDDAELVRGLLRYIEQYTD